MSRAVPLMLFMHPKARVRDRSLDLSLCPPFRVFDWLLERDRSLPLEWPRDRDLSLPLSLPRDLERALTRSTRGWEWADWREWRREWRGEDWMNWRRREWRSSRDEARRVMESGRSEKERVAWIDMGIGGWMVREWGFIGNRIFESIRWFPPMETKRLRNCVVGAQTRHTIVCVPRRNRRTFEVREL